MVAFFIALLVFTAVLMILQLARFGGLLGNVSLNGSGSSDSNSQNQNSAIFGFCLLVFVFVLVAGLLVKFMQVRNNRHISNGEYSRRKLIPLELNSSFK